MTTSEVLTFFEKIALEAQRLLDVFRDRSPQITVSTAIDNRHNYHPRQCPAYMDIQAIIKPIVD
jgi:hypothetical protein